MLKRKAPIAGLHPLFLPNSLDRKMLAEGKHFGMRFHTVIGDISYHKKGDRMTVGYLPYVSKKGAGGKIGFVQF